MKNSANSNPESSLNFLLIAIYVVAFFGIVLLLYGALPIIGDVLFGLKENAAARMVR
jgi:hypothetical protein